MFVENPVKQGVKFKGIRIELLVHVANPRVLVIPMKLQHVAGAVHDGLCTQERVNRRDHRRFDTDFAQRVLKKPVEGPAAIFPNGIDPHDVIFGADRI
jgi:hypothetical protein